MTDGGLTLEELADDYAVCRLPAAASVPSWVAGEFTTVTRTPEELSVTCPARFVPSQIKAERDWVAFKVAGPLDFAMVGVLASLAAPLAEAAISIFVLSTFDTDYLMVQRAARERAVVELERAGHRVESSDKPKDSRS